MVYIMYEHFSIGFMRFLSNTCLCSTLMFPLTKTETKISVNENNMNSLTETKTEMEMFVERKTETKTEIAQTKKTNWNWNGIYKTENFSFKKNFEFGRPLSFVAVYSRSQKELWLFVTGIRLFVIFACMISFLLVLSPIREWRCYFVQAERL